jgi:hypothetical protein
VAKYDYRMEALCWGYAGEFESGKFRQKTRQNAAATSATVSVHSRESETCYSLGRRQ